MMPIQQAPIAQVPNQYRQNYHISQAQSKLLYRSPQNMQPVIPPNTQPYSIVNTLPAQQRGQMTTNQPQQFNPPHYQNQSNIGQGQFISSNNQSATNQQIKLQFVLPSNQSGPNTQMQPQAISSNPQSVQQQIYNPPQNMIYTFQPLSPQPQRNQSQSEYNRSLQRPVSSNIVMPPSIPNKPLPQSTQVNQLPSQNMVPIFSSVPIPLQQRIQSPPNAVYNQYYAVRQNQSINSGMVQSQPQPPFQTQYQPQNQYHPLTQPQIPFVVSSNPAIEQSSVQAHVPATVQNVESAYHSVPVAQSQNISIQKDIIQSKIQISESKYSSKLSEQFHMTKSVQVSNAGQKPSRRSSDSVQKISERIEKEVQENALGSQREGQVSDTNDKLWEQRFVMIYQKFEWFYERYDFISREFQVLSQEFQNVNSEDEWLQLKQKHDMLLQKIQQIHQELINTIHENQQLAEHYQLQNNAQKSSPQQQQVWEHRYHQLLEQYKSLSQNYADLQSQNSQQMTKNEQQKSNTVQKGMSLQEQNQMQLKFHELESQYNVLCDEYEKIRIEYERIYEQNTHFDQQNKELIANNKQAATMASQLQAYVEELQHENDDLRKKQRKSVSHENCISKEQVQKMEIHYKQQIQKYEQELQKYRFTFEQYEEKIELNRQQLQKISEIAMERQNKIKELQSQKIPKSVNIFEQDVKDWREKENDYLHKLEIKDMEKRSLEEKYQLLERELENKKSELEKINKNFEEKLLKIQQNTSPQLQTQTLKQPEEEVKSPVYYQQQSQVLELQSQLQQLQNVFNTKLKTFKDMEEQIKYYEDELRKQTNQLNTTQMSYQKRISEMDIEMSKKIAEKDMKIAKLTGEVGRLNEVCQNSNQEKLSIRQTLKITLQQTERQLTQKHSQKVTDLQKKISESQRNLQEKVQEINLARQMITRFQRQLKTKNDQLIELRNFVTQMKKNTIQSQTSRGDIQALKDQIRTKEEIIERKNDELNKTKREKDYKLKYITQLQHELEFTNSELNKRRTEVSALRRQISELQALETEYDILKSNMNKKITEITQLKQDTHDLEKVKMLSESQSKDLDKLLSDNKDKQILIQSLKDRILELETSANKQNTIQFGQNFLKTQTIEDPQTKQYRQLIKKKDTQISRLNQILQQNQYIIENKSRQLETQKHQSNSVLRSKDSQISSLTHNLSVVQARAQQAENKKQKLSEEINELRISFEQQLKSESERQKTYYDKVISRHQEDYKQIKEKLRAAEQNYNLIEIQLEKTKSNQKKLTLQIKELNNKLNQQASLVVEKQELFSTFRVKQNQSQQSAKALYDKISSIQLQLKTKQQQLKLSEQKNAILQQKIKKNKKDYEAFRNKLIVSQQYENNNSVVQYLSKRIAEYESKMINQSERDFAFKIKDPQANHVFENQIVYQLKIQNEMLRKQLEGKGIQHDRKILSQLQQENLQRSKNLLRNSTFSSKLGNVTSQLLLKDNIQDVNFYKEKNKELQARVEKHLQVNKELKQKIEALIKSNSSPKELEYYKEQITEYENKIVQLEKRIEGLNEENRIMNRDISKRQSRVEERYDERIKDLETKLIQSTKALQQLTQEKSTLQVSTTKLQMQKTSLQEQIKRLNEKINLITKTQNSQSQEQISTLKENCENYESQIAKVTSRCRFLEQQINRLNETNNANKLTLNELNSLKARFNELTQQMAKALNDLHQSQLKNSSLTSQNGALQVKLRTFESENQRLNQMIELYSKKQKTDMTESSNVLRQSSSGLQIQISSLQSQLSILAAQRQEEAEEVNELVGKIRFYEDLLRSLHYELELIRSDVLLQETLIDEISTGGDNLQQVLHELRVGTERKLQCLFQLFEKINRI